MRPEGRHLPDRRQARPGQGVPGVGDRVLEEDGAAVPGVTPDDPLALVPAAARRALAPVVAQDLLVVVPKPRIFTPRRASMRT